MADGLKRIGIIFTGGTIDSLGKDRLDLAWYNETQARMDSRELLGRIPELDAIARIETIPFRRLSSHHLVDKDWLDLLRTIHAVFHDGRSEAVVITHGTNTLEETAYFLNLTLKTDRPVVLVGSMRPSSAVSADGYLNLIQAVRVAAHPLTPGRGSLVVMNDTIYGARDVTKTATYRLQSFQGRDLGPLGYADADGNIVYYHRSEKRHTVDTEFEVGGLESLPRVDVVVSHVGADGALVDAAIGAGARGIVSAGTGAGRPTAAEEEALDRAVQKGVVVCIASRVGSGRVVRSPGFVRRGFVASDNLQPWKARVLLSLALTRTEEPEGIQRMFDVY